MKRRALAKQKRKEILNFIKKHPGIIPNEIKKKMVMSEGSFYYNLEILKSEGKIFIRPSGKNGYFLHLYPLEMINAEIPPEFTPTQNTILKIISKHPGLTIAEITDNLGTTRCNSIYHLKNLLIKGVITRHRISRKFHYYVITRGLNRL